MVNAWLSKRLKQLHKTKSGLARALAIAPARINEVIAGDRQVKVEELPALANYLEITIGEVVKLLTDAHHTWGGETPFSVRGAVQAGHWNPAAQWPEAEWYQLSMPIPERYRNFNVFGLEVHGPSMDIEYPPGTIIQCVSLFEIDREPESGEHVVVERHNDVGDVEMTCKEYRVSPDGERWLMPKSTHPEHQTPLQLANGRTSKVQIVAIVVGSYRPR